MSTYMKALRRLERDGQLAAAPAVPARPWPTREAATRETEAAPARRAVPGAPRSATPAVANDWFQTPKWVLVTDKWTEVN